MIKYTDKIIALLELHPGKLFTVSAISKRFEIPITEKREVRLLLRKLANDKNVSIQRDGKRFFFPSPNQKKKTSAKKAPEKVDLAQEMESIIQELQLPTDFPKEVLEYAESISDKIDSKTIKSRKDLRTVTTVTIDGEKARDFDDAISIEQRPKGQIRLRVSIADVSHYIPAGSVIDREAYARGTSIYFPDRVLPMLPERLSNHICSLVPNEDRCTFTAEIDFDKKGIPVRTDFYKSIIRSDARLTYKQVAQALVDKDKITRDELAPVLPDLELMETLFHRLRQQRMKRGSLDFDLPEPLFLMDIEETRIENIIKAQRTQAHMMIEEFMIAANEAVARFVTENDAPMIYRIHEEPTREKIKDLQRLLHNLGISLKIGKKKIDPKSIAEVIEKVSDLPEKRLINTLILRSLAKAIYDTENMGHFGLASTCYSHFTSPIRRYPDLMVHRILNQVLSKKPKKKSSDEEPFDLRRLSRAAEHSSLRERAAMEAEWAVRDLMQCSFMEDHVGETHAGIISGVTKFGLFIELSTHFVEGLVPVRSLADDFYRFFEDSHSLVGRRTKKRYRMGDPVHVTVTKVNIEKRWIDMELAPPPSDTA